MLSPLLMTCGCQVIGVAINSTKYVVVVPLIQKFMLSTARFDSGRRCACAARYTLPYRTSGARIITSVCACALRTQSVTLAEVQWLLNFGNN